MTTMGKSGRPFDCDRIVSVNKTVISSLKRDDETVPKRSFRIESIRSFLRDRFGH